MKIISQANKLLLGILSKFHKESSDLRFLRYVVEAPVEDGILLYNLLTLEMILLTEDEYEHRNDYEYLRKNWFLVPNDTDDMELADFVMFVVKTKLPKHKHITRYTIFPTTDCNARCFYCFEHGRPHINMSEETAHMVARYICDHCGDEEVRISWFGGEPLLNTEVIDIICSDLKKAGVNFRCGMTSNGYLVDDNFISKASSDWNLRGIQITMDGTEAFYNKIKAFIYKDTNAYQVVLSNIE